MALVNGGTYFFLSSGDYDILCNDNDYQQVYQSLLAGAEMITIGSGQNAKTYYYWPHGSFDPDGLIAAINADITNDDLGALHSIELETAVYWSGYGFQFQ